MILGIIPARYASTRFPGKPLIDIEGRTMIHRVYEQAIKSRTLDRVIVATDDDRIANHVKLFGGEVVMTGSHHPSGTDRCQEVVAKIDGEYEYVINIQGDEPFIHPEQIDELAGVLKGGSDSTEIATLMIAIESPGLLFNTGEVKIALNPAMEALYFSRSPIPYLKGVPESEWHLRRAYYRHVGMYAYRKDVLARITQLAPSSLEKAESLEQLRWLEAGYKIKCAVTRYDSHCIDTPEDVDVVLKMLRDAEKKGK